MVSDNKRKESESYNLDELRAAASFDDEEKQYRPTLGFSFVNRGYAEYRPFVSAEAKKGKNVLTYEPISTISQIPVKQQRYIRNALNSSRASNEHITYEHIKSGSPDFNKQYAQMVLNYFNAKEYLRFKEQHKQSLFESDEQKTKFSDKEYIQKQFVAIPKRTRENLMLSLGLRPENITHYTLDNKKEIVALYGVQKAERTLDRDFKKIPPSIKKEIMSDLSLDHTIPSHYSRQNKRQILDIFGSEYAV